MSFNETILGKGVSFPIELEDGKPVIAEVRTLIKSSINIILGWDFLDRYFMAQFGSKLRELLEEPNDDILKALVEFYVFESLSTWEKRIKILNSSIVVQDREKMDVFLEYVIVNTEIKDSFTYPFYLKRLI